MATTSTQPSLQFLYGSDLATKNPSFKQGTIYLDLSKHELWYDTPKANTGEHIKLFKDTYLSLTGGTLSGNLLPSGTRDLGSSTQKWNNLYVTKINNSSIGAAMSKGVKDNTSATALSSSGTNLVTERAVYYGLPTINNAHNYNSSTTIYAPTTGGTSGYILKSSGGTSAPVWATVDSLMGAYVKKAGDTMTGALTISKNTASTSMTTGALLVTGGIATQDQLSAKTIEINDKATVQYDSTRQALRFVIA